MRRCSASGGRGILCSKYRCRSRLRSPLVVLCIWSITALPCGEDNQWCRYEELTTSGRGRSLRVKFEKE